MCEIILISCFLLPYVSAEVKVKYLSAKAVQTKQCDINCYFIIVIWGYNTLKYLIKLL
jgi:hypothetical protein